MVTEAEVVRGLVATVKVALAAPAGTVTLARTAPTAVLLLESPIVAPPASAGALRVTVPVETVPPITLAGFRFMEVSVAGANTESTAVRVAPSQNAVMLTSVELGVAEPVDTVKLALVAPGGTVT